MKSVLLGIFLKEKDRQEKCITWRDYVVIIFCEKVRVTENIKWHFTLYVYM